MEMKKYKLGDVLEEFHSGNNIKAADIKDVGEYPVFGANGLRGYTDRYNCDGDVAIIGRQGAYCGNVKFFSGKAYYTEHAVIAKPKKGFDAKYLACKLPFYQLEKYQGQSAQPGLSVGTLSLIEVELPSYENQKEVALVLSTLDQRIENLRAQNRVLEQTAKTIYDYAFLQCAGHQTTYNKTLNRNIPADWEVKNMSELAEVINGATPSTAEEGNFDGDIVWITPKDLSDQKSKFVYFGERTITQKGYDSCSTTLVPVNSILMSSRAPIGLVSIAKCELCTNQGFKTFVPKSEDCTEYLYYYLLTNMKKIEQLGSGTTFKEVSRGCLTSFPVIVPDKKTLDVFNASIKPLFQKQFVNTKQIETLTTQRNTLLPLLMTGQVVID